jgi:hypothetical protein
MDFSFCPRCGTQTLTRSTREPLAVCYQCFVVWSIMDRTDLVTNPTSMDLLADPKQADEAWADANELHNAYSKAVNHD